MKLTFRHLVRDIAVYGTGDLVLRATAFITMPIYTRILTPEDYGIWNLVATVVGLLSGILILGGDSAYIRFFFEAKTRREQQLITSTWLCFLSLWSGSVVLLCLPLAGLFSHGAFGTAQHGILFSLALLAAPVQLTNGMCGQVLRSQFRAHLFAALNVASTLFSIGLSLYGAVILGLGLTGIMGGALVAAIIMLPIRLWTARPMLRPVFSIRVFRRMLGFGVPLMPVTLAYWVFGSSDRIVLGKLSTLHQLGLYAIANSVTSVLGLVRAALSQAWGPHSVRMYEEQPEAAPQFFGRVMTYLLVGFGLLTVAMTAFAREILALLSTPAFSPAALAIGPLALGFMAYASTQVTASGIWLTKKTKYLAVFSWMAALLNLTLNVLLVPRWGMMASAWATAASYAFLTVAYLITSQRLWPIAYEKRRALGAVGATVGITVAALFLPEMPLVPSLMVKGAYCLGYVGLLFVARVLDKREWNAALRALQELRIDGAGEPA